ncbi:hypothetical protein CEE69_26620 [Rhodopirellula bahusiensis]|uniref:Uncharacterized protein n=2 Tax=Rhodopirellula bahusiensis TaxID=2014065 RepID=A0A2G1VZV0_9BACT|nr:hypothetical protein CEE69_26620 [Rhodopirellula bahusiensis]
MSARSATARLAMLACLALFVLSLIPTVPPRFFAFSAALLCLGLPAGYVVPGFDKPGLGFLLDLAIGGWVSWLLYPQIREAIVENSGGSTACIITVSLAIVAYAILVYGIRYLLGHSERLRQFSTVADTATNG